MTLALRGIRRIMSLLAPVVLGILASGCGGNVTLDPPSSDGAGGAAGGLPLGGAAGGSSTGGEGGALVTLCDAYCENTCLALPTCDQDCAEAATDVRCGEAWLDFAACLSAAVTPPVCDSLDQCRAEEHAYHACEGPCGREVCASADDGTCSCETTCTDAGSLRLFAGCAPDATSGRGLDCKCFVDYELVGVCSAPPSERQPCDLTLGCCASFFRQALEP